MNFIKNNLLLIVCAIASIVFCDSALASTSMPWDTGIKNIQESLTGPVATGISLIGLIAAGAMLVFGGEISGFLKQLIYLVLAISLILCGNSFITNVMGHKGGSTGATIAYVQMVDLTDNHTIVINS
jgi:type IV secretion system protein VirB2